MFWGLGFGYMISLRSWFRVQGSGLMVWALGFRI